MEAVDYLEADPAAAAAAEQQAPTVLAIDVTSDAPDLELLKQALLQVHALGRRAYGLRV